MQTLYEDNHLIAVDKPAGIATMGAKAGVRSLADEVKEHIRRKYKKPGNVYLGVVSRLDQVTSGVVLFGRTSKAAARLTEAFRTRQVAKFYLAAVESEPPERTGTLMHHMAKDDRQHRMHTTHERAPGAKRAELTYQRLGSGPLGALLLVKPITGRKHQIRVQLAKIGCPIVGDTKYGATTNMAGDGVALHAWRLELEHPVRREPVKLQAWLPRDWERVWRLSREETAARAIN